MKYNKSNICKRANELIRVGHTKSDAFRQAWAETKTEPKSIADKAREFKELQKMIEELEAKANALKDEIISDMDGEEEINADTFTIRYTTVIRNILDTPKFKNENSELYSMYLKENKSKRFTVGA